MNYLSRHKKIKKTCLTIILILIIITTVLPRYVYADFEEWMSVNEYENLFVGGTDTKPPIYTCDAIKRLAKNWGITLEQAQEILKNHADDPETLYVGKEIYENTVYMVYNVAIKLTDEEKKKYGLEDLPVDEDGKATADTSYFGNQNKSSDLEGARSGTIGGVLFEPIAWLIQAIGDTANFMLQRVLLGTWDSVFYSTGVAGILDNAEVEEVIERNPPISNLTNVNIVKNYIKGLTNNYGVPEIKITPVDIFAGNVAALDANFFAEDENIEDKLGGQERSIVVQLKKYIAQWYVALRNIAIVGLLSVLLYIGIRIIISSSAGDKAKYKQMFTDWVIALCLIFFMHYIMAFTMTMAETVTKVLEGPTDDNTKQNGTIKQVNIVFTDENGSPDGTSFSSNFTGVARIKADYQDFILKMGYSILYIGLTGYAIYFTIVYLKRLLMLAFFTMIAPLVALTYPIDKVKDGKAQAFNYWFKEYMFYALLQPMHMVLYTVLVSSAIQIAADNLLYAIVALAFIVPAEKILKQMFGIKGQTESSIAGFAGGAIATQAFNALKHGGQGKKTQAGGEKPVRTSSNPNSPDEMEILANNAMAQGNKEESSTLKDTAAAAAKGAADGKAIEAAVAKSNEEDRETSETSEHDSGKVEQQNDKENEVNRQLAEMKAKGLTLGKNSGTLPQAQSNNKEENKFSAYRKQLSNNLKKAVNRRYVAAGGWKGIGKNVGKGYIKAAGAITGAAVGTGFGIVGGDLEDIAKGGAAGFAGGVYAGGKASSAIANAGNSSVGRFFGEVAYGDNYQKRQFIKQYMNNAEYKQRIMDKNPNISADELKEMQMAQAEMAYDAKLTNYSDIKGAVKLEKTLQKQGVENAHDMAVATAKMAKNYDNSTFTDQKKFENAQKQLQKKLEKQINEQIEERYKENSAEINKHKAKSAAQADEQARKVLENISKIKGI